MIMPFLPVLDFIPAQCFMITHQYQLIQGGILTEREEPQVHQRILKNTLTSLHPQLKKSSNHLYALNLQVKIRYFRFITEPDLAITIPHNAFSDQYYSDIWHNPVVLIEVLSPEDKREHKFKFYRQLASLHEYVRIETDHYRIEHFVKQPTKEWKSSQIQNWGDMLHLVSVNCDLSLAAVYDKIQI